MIQLLITYQPQIGLFRIFRWIYETVGKTLSEVSGREAYFLRIVEQHSDIISGICRSFASKDSEFEDLRQDALLNIWRGVSSFRNDSNIKTWIYRVTLNTCVSTYRKNTGKIVKVDVSLSLNNITEPERTTWEDAQWLDHIVSQLPAEDHAIIMMWLDDLSYDEIAEVMGMKRNTVATRIRRIKQHLKEIYSKKI